MPTFVPAHIEYVGAPTEIVGGVLTVTVVVADEDDAQPLASVPVTV